MATSQIVMLDLLLRARYMGNQAFRAMSGDIASLANSTSGLEKVGHLITAIGDAMVATSVVSGVFWATSIKQASDYQQSLNRLVATHTVLASQLPSISNTIMKVSTQYGIKSTDIAQGSYFALSTLTSYDPTATLAQKESLIQNLAAYVAASGNGQPGSVNFLQASQDVLHVIGALQVPASQWGSAIGSMVAVENRSGLSQSQLIASLLRGAPLVSTIGMNFNQLVAATGASATLGVVGARSGTELGRALQTIFTNKAALTEMGNLGLNPASFLDKQGKLTDFGSLLSAIIAKTSQLAPIQRMAALHTLFGGVGERVMNQLIQSQGVYSTLYKATQGNTQQNMLQVATQMSSSFAGSLLKAQAAWQNFQIVLGSDVLPALAPIIDGVTAALVRFTTAIEKMNPQQIRALFVGSTAGLFGGGVALKYGGNILTAVGQHQRLASESKSKAEQAAQAAMNDWRNKVAIGNQSADLAVVRDQAQKQRAYERAYADWKGQQTSISSQMSKLIGQKGTIAKANQSDLEALRAEYISEISRRKARMNFNIAKAEKDFGLGTPEYDAAKQAEKDAYLADKELYQRNFKVASAVSRNQHLSELNNVKKGISALRTQRLKLGAAPSQSSFMTPFDGELAALPIKPQAEEAVAKNLFSRLFSHGQAVPGKIASHLPGFLASHFPAATMMWKDLKPAANKTVADKAVQGMALLPRTLGAGIGAIGDMAGHIGTLGQKIGSLATGGLTKFIGLFKMLPGLFMAGISAIPGLIAGFAAIAIPVALVVGGIVALVLAFTRYRTETMSVIHYISGQLAPIFNFFKMVVLDVVHSLQEAWTRVAPQVDAAMGQLLQAFKNAAPVFQVLGGILLGLLGVVLVVVGGIISGLMSALPPVIRIFTDIVNIIGGAFALIGDLIHGNWTGVWNDFLGILGGVWDIFKNLLAIPLSIIKGFFSFIVSLFGKGAEDAVHNFINGFLFNFPVLGGVIHGIADLIGGIIGDGNSPPKHGPLKNTKKAGANVVKSFADGMNSQKPSLTNQTLGMYQDMQNAITNMQNEQQMYKDGQAVVQGFINGVRSLNKELASTMTDMSGIVQATVSHGLGIGSPSRVFHRFGQWTMQGYMDGITSMSGQVANTMHSAIPTSFSDRQQLALSLALSELHVDSLTVGSVNGLSQSGSGESPSYAKTYLQTRAVQAQREALIQPSTNQLLDNAYRTAYQFTA